MTTSPEAEPAELAEPAEPAGPALLGVRHHGPGSARAVRRALSAYQPQIVLIEGPPEADPLVPLAGLEEMRAPVALLAYPAATARPSTAGTARTAGTAQTAGTAGTSGARAAFWPFAEFSPEWQALRWAVAHEVPVRFIDLPAAAQLAAEDPAPGKGEHTDPLGALAAAAGYDDPERWWEDVVEHRQAVPEEGADQADGDAGDRAGDQANDQANGLAGDLAAALRPFDAIAEAMAEVRRAQEPAGPTAERPSAEDPVNQHTVYDYPDDDHLADERLIEQRREAAMRTGLRAALREYERVAVVCGAWHVPALRLTAPGDPARRAAPVPTAAADARLLRGIPKVKAAMTWVPWTHARLASGQGYGAGVRSPGWYHHLFATPPAESVTRWLVRAADVLRRDGLPVSTAHTIEAARLAGALATMRGRPVPGLAEVTDAALAVLCEGDALRLELIQRRLVVGERLGAVPRGTPGVPLARDVAASQRRLRLPPQPEPREIDLDLRREIDLARSQLLHRLGLLGVEWGVALAARAGKGTFWESWKLAWQPEFAVDLVEASGYGTTVRDAAHARLAERAAAAGSLAEVSGLVERCLLAELPGALPEVLRALDDRMARDHDVAHLMEALPPLTRTLRYGDVRRTDLPALRHAVDGLITRICVALPAAVTSLDDAAAAATRDRIDAVHAAVALIERPEFTASWYELLIALSTRDDMHGLLAGRVNKLLLDAGRLDVAEAGRRMSLALTVGVPVARAAAWIEGFLAGDGLLLVHDEQLLALVDTWLTHIGPDAFVEVLPLLRRTFSEYPPPQRRQIGERAVRLGAAGGHRDPAADGIDGERADLVLPTIAALLNRRPA